MWILNIENGSYVMGIKPLAKISILVLSSLASGQALALKPADGDLWGADRISSEIKANRAEAKNTASKTDKNAEPEKEVSSSGVGLGNWVTFKGVGEVFYAGTADGASVYFGKLDEPGGYEHNKAADTCTLKGAGWVLPTKSQLNLLYTNRDEINLIDKGLSVSSANWYWSRTLFDTDSAWRQRLTDGYQQQLKLKFFARVRCARVY